MNYSYIVNSSHTVNNNNYTFMNKILRVCKSCNAFWKLLDWKLLHTQTRHIIRRTGEIIKIHEIFFIYFFKQVRFYNHIQ